MHSQAEEHSILDAIEHWTDGIRRHRGVDRAFAELMAHVMAGKIIVAGRIGRLMAERQHLPAWWGAHLLPGPAPFYETLLTPEGEVIYEVGFREARFAGSTGTPVEDDDAPPDAAAGAVDDGPSSGPLLGAATAAAEWIVAQSRSFDLDQLREAFGAFGIELSENGQSILNSPETASGDERRASSGRKPSVALALVEARIRRNSLLPRKQKSSIAAAARAEIAWLAAMVPCVVTSTSPAQRNVERLIARSNPKKTRTSVAQEAVENRHGKIAGNFAVISSGFLPGSEVPRLNTTNGDLEPHEHPGPHPEAEAGNDS
jgi:hypothetical protein